MASDFTRLTPAELVRLLNSTRLGTVINERRLYRHRQMAGLRIGDADHVHLIRYGRWLAGEMTRSPESEPRMGDTETQRQQYEAHKRRAARRQADIAEAGQEIGPPDWDGIDWKRRDACERDFRKFCETYMPAVFRLAWSDDHLRAIAKIEAAVLGGKLFALAMPRGSGKTSLCLAACLWALVYGHHRYVCLVAATDRRARKLLAIGIFNALERNELLFEDFPEVCHPIRSLERTPQRAPKQKCNGRYTNMLWTKVEIVLPTIYREDGTTTPASGAIVSVCGLTGGEVRGQVKDMPDGGMLRPTLVLLDDPQTKASAKSVTQTQDRIELLMGDVLGMAGPDSNIAGMMPCTVIRPEDMADQILDANSHPEWQGERTKMVYAFPNNEKLWEEYHNLYRAGLRRGDASAATTFYRKHRAAMDAGSRVAWPHRFPPDCISALQHAMNLKIRDEAMFFAEYQNEPMTGASDSEMLTAEQIAGKLNRRPEAVVPTSCGKLAMFVDVQKRLLYWGVAAFEPNFTSYLVAYGTWPDQKRHFFAYREARSTLLTRHRGHGEEAAIYAGLEKLTDELLGRTWRREDGAEMRISLCLIDSGYQTKTVDLFARQSKYAAIIMPAKGVAITASSQPFDERKPRKGEEVGENWKVTAPVGESGVRLVLADSNYWKSFLHARLATPIGDPGCLSLWGKSEARHRMLAEHLVAESPVETSGRGRKLTEWKHPAHKPDNHLLDVGYGLMVAGSMMGAALLGRVIPAKRRAKAKKKRAVYLGGKRK